MGITCIMYIIYNYHPNYCTLRNDLKSMRLAQHTRVTRKPQLLKGLLETVIEVHERFSNIVWQKKKY